MAMEGHKLIEKVAELTGLPGETATTELAKLVTKHGFNSESVTLNDLREILAEYLQDVLLEAKRELAANFVD